MIKVLLLALMFPLATQALTWEQYIAKKRTHISHEKHLPFRLTHGHKTAHSVLLVHGIYSSPRYFKGMANAFYRAGYNVVTVLLPGHYDKDLQSINTTTNKDWSAEVDQGYQFAKELGDKVILAGHSLGGLLSMEQALKRPQSEITAVVMISPALKVWPAVMAACHAGVALGLSGNVFTPHRPDGIDIPYFGPIGGPLIQTLANRVLVRTPDVPVFMAYTWNDNVVDVPFLKKYFKKLKNPKQVRVYGLFSGVAHGDISQGPEDASTYGNKTNHDFDAMMNEALDFIDQYK